MEWSLFFVFNSILLGVGLAMDAFSVSLANGLNESWMHKKKMCAIAGTFGFFQALMPMTGWVCVHTIIEYFKMFEKFIPWIALILLLFIGGKMVREGIQDGAEEVEKAKVGALALLVQGIATSIDALSVGFTIAEYDFIMALACSLIIAVVTFVISFAGLILGKKFLVVRFSLQSVLKFLFRVFSRLYQTPVSKFSITSPASFEMPMDLFWISNGTSVCPRLIQA